MALAFLYLFRSAAIAVYVLCGLCEWICITAKDKGLLSGIVTDNYVLSVSGLQHLGQ